MTNHAPEPTKLRIRPWWAKLAFVVAGAALVYLAPAIPVGAVGAGILRSVLAFALILLGARLFRGTGEEVAPPRAWWRMTAAVPSGILLGSVCSAVALVSAVGYVGIVVSNLPHTDTADLPSLLLNTLLSAILAYLYFGSSRRLVIARRQAALSVSTERIP